MQAVLQMLMKGGIPLIKRWLANLLRIYKLVGPKIKKEAWLKVNKQVLVGLVACSKET
jgi:hypothetical protein